MKLIGFMICSMGENNCRVSLFCCLMLCMFTMAGPLSAQTRGVTENEIVIGQSCALKGHARALGEGMRDGALAYFKYINEKGGIRGRRIRLESHNDGYEPDECVKNTRRLLDDDKAFLLFGYVGTPTSVAVKPIVNERMVPFFGPFTGAEVLRDPLSRYIFNIRSSYYRETDKMVEHLMEDRGIERISVFYQDDSYGMSGLEGVRKALARKGRQVLNDASYTRNTLDVESAVEPLMMTRPGAVVLIGSYEPCAKFIKLMRESGSDAIFLNVSSVGAEALGVLLANEGLGVVVTQVVPFPYDKRIPIAAEFDDLIKKYMPKLEPGFVSMEGFIAAKALCEILNKTPEPLTREAFIDTAESQSNLDLGGFPFSFSSDRHQGSDLVYLTQLGPGGFISPVENLNQLYRYWR